MIQKTALSGMPRVHKLMEYGIPEHCSDLKMVVTQNPGRNDHTKFKIAICLSL